jgi:hypothetical protein
MTRILGSLSARTAMISPVESVEASLQTRIS